MMKIFVLCFIVAFASNVMFHSLTELVKLFLLASVIALLES